MRTETKEYKIFKFEELDERSKSKAIDYFRDVNVNHGWWDHIECEIKDYGGELIEFDTGRSCLIRIKIDSPEIFAREILKNHGEGCDTYKAAKNFIDETDKFYCIDSDEFTYDQTEQLKQIESEFIKEISEEYLSLLRSEYEYLISDEAVRETIEANEYEFLEDGEYYI